ncbi:hypothetical protein [Cryptosporangium phraense]|uniref:Uncharacterized protein n=1 Tax=Cryptosporangium phraense TaxID=2593070 RepID=A0A545AL23_9ACTN|nr:hypothetical protein [Cryptosporangium phraense]TQS41981.1 hypothetical protein FL583_27260 [Cryptosporangium phraense]
MFGQRATAFWTVVAGIIAIPSCLIGLLQLGMPGGAPAATTSAPPAVHDTYSPASAATSATAITVTFSDDLTDGAAEETIAISLNGEQLPQLHASTSNPQATTEVTAATEGTIGYVADAEIYWYDSGGVLRRTAATGRGEIYLADGAEIAVYLHEDGNGGYTLSLDTVS